MESAYASNNSLTTTLLKNKDGAFVAPTMAAFQATAKNADWTGAANFAVDLNNEPVLRAGRSKVQPSCCCRPIQNPKRRAMRR